MVGFKAFRGFGRKKSVEPDNDDRPTSKSSTAPSFRVIPREGNNPTASSVESRLPWSLNRRSWVGSERDSSMMDRGGNANSPRYSVLDPASRYDSPNSDNQSIAYTSPMPRGKIPNRPVTKTRSRGFLDIPNGLDDDFGDDMFSGIGDEVKAPPPIVLRTESEQNMGQVGDWRTPDHSPSPLAYRRLEMSASPYSQDSRNSRDGLLSGPSSADVSPSPKPLQPPSRFSRMPDSLMEDLDRLAPPPIMRRTESTESFTRSPANEDADAAIVRNSVISSQQRNIRGPNPIDHKPIRSSLKPPTESTISSSENSVKSPSMSSSSSLGFSDHDAKKKTFTGSASTTPRPSNTSIPIIKTNDELVQSTNIRTSPRKRISQVPISRPSITPVSATSRSTSRESISGDFSISPGNSTIKGVRTSIIEAPKGMVRKQSMSNNPPPEVIINPPKHVKRASHSAPNLLAAKPVAQAFEHQRKVSSDDDDDDIPLALLQANNFPSRGKTPEPRLSQSPSMMTLNQRTSSFGAPSAGAPSVMGPRSSLPPFARKIPLAEDVFMDPSGNRASMARQTPPPGMSPVPGMPPGGLVGVIAEEERFRGIRRAGPNPAPLNPGMSMGMNPMGSMAIIPGLGPGLGPVTYGMMDPNLANQQAIMETLQAVQQQNAMLQQLFAMHVQSSGGQSPMLMQDPTFGNGPGSPNLARPASVMSGSYQQQQMPMIGGHARTQSMVNLSRPGFAPRTMSMVDVNSPFPNQNAWETQSFIGGPSMNGLGFNYAPSIAPSERSNVGQPSRYRPVSAGMADGGSITGDVKSSGGLNMNGAGMGMRNSVAIAPTAANVEDAKKKRVVLNAVIHPKGKVGEVAASVNGEEAEEEEDWGTFARRRRQKA